MRATTPRRFFSALVFAAALACSQDEGEPCQHDRDCDEGLVCNRGLGSSRGTCEAPGSSDAGPGDAGTAGAAGGAGGAGGMPSAEDAAAMPSDDAGGTDADGG